MGKFCVPMGIMKINTKNLKCPEKFRKHVIKVHSEVKGLRSTNLQL